jgi:hypothetical protein
MLLKILKCQWRSLKREGLCLGFWVRGLTQGAGTAQS